MAEQQSMWDRISYIASSWFDRFADEGGWYDASEALAKYDDEDMTAAQWFRSRGASFAQFVTAPFDTGIAMAQEANRGVGAVAGILVNQLLPMGFGEGPTGTKVGDPAYQRDYITDYFSGGISPEQREAYRQQGMPADQLRRRYEPASGSDLIVWSADHIRNTRGSGALWNPLSGGWVYKAGEIFNPIEGKQRNGSYLPAAYDIWAPDAGVQLWERSDLTHQLIASQVAVESALDPLNFLATPIAVAIKGATAPRLVARAGQLVDSAQAAQQLAQIGNVATDMNRWQRAAQWAAGRGTWDGQRMLTNMARNPRVYSHLQRLAETKDVAVIRRMLDNDDVALGEGADALASVIAVLDDPQEVGSLLYAAAYRDEAAFNRIIARLQNGVRNAAVENTFRTMTGGGRNVLESAFFEFGNGIIPEGHLLTRRAGQFVDDAVTRFDAMAGVEAGTPGSLRAQWDALADATRQADIADLERWQGAMRGAEQLIERSKTGEQIVTRMPTRGASSQARRVAAAQAGISPTRTAAFAEYLRTHVVPSITVHGRSMRTAGTVYLMAKPGLVFDLHGVDAFQRVEGFVKYADGIVGSAQGAAPRGRFADLPEVRALLDEFIAVGADTRAPQQARAEIVNRLQQLAIQRIAEARGIHPAAAEVLAEAGMRKSRRLVDGMNAVDSGYASNLLEDGRPVFFKSHPSTLRQTANHVPIMDLKALDDALKARGTQQAFTVGGNQLSVATAEVMARGTARNLVDQARGTMAKYGTERDEDILRNVGRSDLSAATHMIIDMADEANTIFKAWVLLRLGYGFRNITEAHLSAFASGVGWLGVMRHADLPYQFSNFLYNRWNSPFRWVDRMMVNRGYRLSDDGWVRLGESARKARDHAGDRVAQLAAVASNPDTLDHLVEAVNRGGADADAAAQQLRTIFEWRARMAHHLTEDMIDSGLIPDQTLADDLMSSAAYFHADTSGALDEAAGFDRPISVVENPVVAQAAVDGAWSAGPAWAPAPQWTPGALTGAQQFPVGTLTPAQRAIVSEVTGSIGSSGGFRVKSGADMDAAMGAIDAEVADLRDRAADLRDLSNRNTLTAKEAERAARAAKQQVVDEAAEAGTIWIADVPDRSVVRGMGTTITKADDGTYVVREDVGWGNDGTVLGTGYPTQLDAKVAVLRGDARTEPRQARFMPTVKADYANPTKTNIDRIINELGAEVDSLDRDGYGLWEIVLFAPEGKVWEATTTNTLVVGGFEKKADLWRDLQRDLRLGLVDDAPDWQVHTYEAPASKPTGVTLYRGTDVVLSRDIGALSQEQIVEEILGSKMGRHWTGREKTAEQFPVSGLRRNPDKGYAVEENAIYVRLKADEPVGSRAKIHEGTEGEFEATIAHGKPVDVTEVWYRKSTDDPWTKVKLKSPRRVVIDDASPPITGAGIEKGGSKVPLPTGSKPDGPSMKRQAATLDQRRRALEKARNSLNMQAQWTARQKSLEKAAKTNRVQWRRNPQSDWVDWKPQHTATYRDGFNPEFRTIPGTGAKPRKVQIDAWSPMIDLTDTRVVDAVIANYPDFPVKTLGEARAGDRAAQEKLMDVFAKEGFYRVKFPEPNPAWNGEHVMLHPDAIGEKAFRRHVEEMFERATDPSMAPRTGRSLLADYTSQSQRRMLNAGQEVREESINKPAALQLQTPGSMRNVARVLQNGGFEPLMEEAIGTVNRLNAEIASIEAGYLTREQQVKRRAKRHGARAKEWRIPTRFQYEGEFALRVNDALHGHDGGAFAQVTSSQVQQHLVYSQGAHHSDLMADMERAMLDPEEIHPGSPRFWEGMANFLGRHGRDTPGARTPMGVQTADIDPVLLRAMQRGDREQQIRDTVDWVLHTPEGREWARSMDLEIVGSVDEAIKRADAAMARRMKGVKPAVTRAQRREVVSLHWSNLRNNPTVLTRPELAEVIRAQFNFVDTHLPTDRARDLFRSGNATADTLRRAWEAEPWQLQPFNGLLSPTHATFRKAIKQQRANQAGMGRLSSWIIEKMGKGLEAVGTKPETMLARHPVYQQIVYTDLKQRIAFAEATQDTPLTMDQVLRLRSLSQQYGVRQLEKTLYTMKSRSSVDEFMRFVMPFFPAWKNTVHRWGRFSMENPARIAQLGRMYQTTIEQLPYYDFTTGEEVFLGEGADPDQSYTLLPGIAAIPFIGRMLPDGLKEAMSRTKVNLGTWDVIFQGEPTNPGMGPLVAITVQEFMNRNQELYDSPMGKAIVKGWLQKYGPAQTGKGSAVDALYAWLPSAAKPLANSLLDTNQQKALRIKIGATYVANGYDQNPDGTYKTQQQIDAEINHAVMVMNLTRVFSYLTSPIATQPVGEQDYYAAQYRAMREAYEDDDAAANVFLQRFGHEKFLYTQSLTENYTGGQATSAVVANQRDQRELQQEVLDRWDNPKALGFFENLSPDGVLMPYDPEAYNPYARDWQMRNAPAGSQEKWRSGKELQDYLEDADVSLGWRYYDEGMDRIEMSLSQQGLVQGTPEWAAERARRSSALSAYVGQLVPRWADSRSVIDTDRTEKNADMFWWAINESEWGRKNAGLPIVKSMAAYLQIREWARAQISYRNSLDPSHPNTLGAEKNADIAAEVLYLRERLSQDSPTFKQWVDQFFRTDDVSYTEEKFPGQSEVEAITR